MHDLLHLYRAFWRTATLRSSLWSLCRPERWRSSPRWPPTSERTANPPTQSPFSASLQSSCPSLRWANPVPLCVSVLRESAKFELLLRVSSSYFWYTQQVFDRFKPAKISRYSLTQSADSMQLESDSVEIWKYVRCYPVKMSINQGFCFCRELSVRLKPQKTPEAPDCLPLWPGRSKKYGRMSGQTDRPVGSIFSLLSTTKVPRSHTETLKTNGKRDHFIYSKQKETKVKICR